MKKGRKKISVCLIMVVVSALFLCACMEKEKKYETYFYEETQEYVKNPYQGLYFQFTTKDPYALQQEAEKNPDCTMVLVAFNLDDEFDTEVIPDEKMDDLRQTLQEAERLGLSVIVRSAYDFSGEIIEPEFSILLGHIEQIAEVINENKTCVAGVQAGMIGPFGEWNKSKYMEEKSYRLEVVEQWLGALDEEIPLSLRRQKFIREVQNAGMDSSRLGIYNDGLFSSESDLGTYVEDYDREEELEWSEVNLNVPFNGGEMPYVSEFTHIENVAQEASRLQLSYLNRNYHEDVWELWESERLEEMSGDDYIRKYLGVRPWVYSLSITEEYYKQKEIEINIVLKNTGFAMLSPSYEAYVIYTYNGKEIRQKAQISMDYKRAGSIQAVFENPYYEEEAGVVTVELEIARAGCSNTEYFVQMANTDIPYENGTNLLLTYSKQEEAE